MGTLLAFTGLFSAAIAFTPGYYDVTQDFGTGAMNMLSLYLDNNTMFNAVLDHGCHCARFDPLSQKSILGGNKKLDDLDALCREWYSARSCLDKYLRGTCYLEDNTNYGYQVAITVDVATEDPDLIFCNDFHSATSLPYNKCEKDSCKVDAHYVKLIREWLDMNYDTFVSTKVTSGSTCPIYSASSIDPKYCAGDAPYVYIESGIPPDTTETPTTTTAIPVVKEYGSQAAGHLVFIIDRSSENNVTQFNDGIDVIVGVVAPLTISPTHTVVSIIGMSDVNNIYVTEAQSQAEFDAAIAFIRTDQASVPDRDMSGAVDMASQLLGLRSFLGFLLELTIVLITGGGSSTSGDVVDSNTGQTVNIYEEVHSLNITVMAVGIGSQVNETELTEVASDPTLEFVIDSNPAPSPNQPVNAPAPTFADLFTAVIDRVTEVFVQIATGLAPTASPPPPTTTTMTTSVSVPYNQGVVTQGTSTTAPGATINPLHSTTSNYVTTTSASTTSDSTTSTSTTASTTSTSTTASTTTSTTYPAASSTQATTTLASTAGPPSTTSNVVTTTI